MAVEKKNTVTLHKKSRLEMNVRQLLNKCELIAKQEPIDSNWRLRKYVDSLTEMLTELKTGSDKPGKEALAEYSKRAAFLKGLIQTATLNSPIEKVSYFCTNKLLLGTDTNQHINWQDKDETEDAQSLVSHILSHRSLANLYTSICTLEAVQLLSHGAATMCADASAQEIHQKTVAKYGDELRAELFGLEDSDDALRKRNIIKAPNFTSNSSSQEDIDSLLKYHQNMQEKVAENMVMLTRSLKEQSQIASTIIKADTEALKTSSDLTDRNLMTLKKESDRLQEHSKSAWKCWLWLMLAVVMAIFINMVLFMKVMKKRKVDL